jgi:hypothetical protein
VTSGVSPLERSERRRRRRRPRVARSALRAAFVLAVFGLGVAVGEAIHDNPRPGQIRTQVRTLPPPGTSR